MVDREGSQEFVPCGEANGSVHVIARETRVTLLLALGIQLTVWKHSAAELVDEEGVEAVLEEAGVVKPPKVRRQLCGDTCAWS